MRGLAVGSALAAISAELSAKLSFRRPHKPLGSAAEIAIPAIVTLSRRSFHSSGVKFDLSATYITPSYVCIRSHERLSRFITPPPRWCRLSDQSVWEAHGKRQALVAV